MGCASPRSPMEPAKRRKLSLEHEDDETGFSVPRTEKKARATKKTASGKDKRGQSQSPKRSDPPDDTEAESADPPPLTNRYQGSQAGNEDHYNDGNEPPLRPLPVGNGESGMNGMHGENPHGMLMMGGAGGGHYGPPGSYGGYSAYMSPPYFGHGPPAGGYGMSPHMQMPMQQYWSGGPPPGYGQYPPHHPMQQYPGSAGPGYPGYPEPGDPYSYGPPVATAGQSPPPPPALPQAMDANAKAATMGLLTHRTPSLLYMSCDDDSLSGYQCLVRRQIELFEARSEDVESNAQGRNKPIVLGQVGIRCRHCTSMPPRHRARASVYYPAKLMGLYQAAQNMATIHLCHHCQRIPSSLRSELLTLRERKSSAGGGKKYWGDGARVLGVYEAEDGLRFDGQ